MKQIIQESKDLEDRTRESEVGERIDFRSRFSNKVAYFIGKDRFLEKGLDYERVKAEMPLAIEFLSYVPVVDFDISQKDRTAVMVPFAFGAPVYDFWEDEYKVYIVKGDQLFGKKPVEGSMSKSIHRRYGREAFEDLALKVVGSTPDHTVFYLAQKRKVTPSDKRIKYVADHRGVQIYDLEELKRYMEQDLPGGKFDLFTDQAKDLMQEYFAQGVLDFSRKISIEDDELKPLKEILPEKFSK